jgi:hypothetical protein
MQPILEYVGKSFGGVLCHKIDIVEAEGVLTEPDVALGYRAPLALKEGYNWAEVKCRRNSARFAEKNPTDGGAMVYSAQLQFELRRDWYETIHKLREMSRKGLVVRFTDRNGNMKLMGRATAPVRLIWERDNGKESQDINIMSVLMTASDRMPVVQTQE